MKARTWNKRHILFGMLIMTLGMSKAWVLTADEVTGSADLALSRSELAKKNEGRRAQTPRSGENRTPEKSRSLGAPSSFSSKRPSVIPRSESDKSKEHKASAKVTTPSSPTTTTESITDPDKIKVVLETPEDSPQSTAINGKPIIVRKFKVIDENGKTIRDGVTLISNKEVVANEIKDGKVQAGKGATVAVASTKVGDCENCVAELDVSKSTDALKDVVAHIQKQQIAFEKSELAKKKQAEKEERENKAQKEREDAEREAREERIARCESRMEGDREVDLRNNDKYLYSRSHLSCVRSNMRDMDPEDKREQFAELAEDLTEELRNADTAKERNAIMRKIRQAERTFKRDGDISMDAKFLSRGAQSMAKISEYSVTMANNPNLRDTLIKAEVQNFLSYTQRGYSERTRELVKEWAHNIDEYARSMNQQPTIGLPGTSSSSTIGSAPAFSWNTNNRQRVDVGTRQIPGNLPPYNRNMPNQFSQNNNSNFRTPIDYNRTGGRVEMSRIPRP